jgi:protease-4
MAEGVRDAENSFARVMINSKIRIKVKIMRRGICLLIVAMLTGLSGCGGGQMAYKITPIPASEELQETTVASDPGAFLPKVAIVDIEGTISNSRKSTLFGEGENMMALTVEKLQKAAADPKVKAVVLRINSPGGTITASDILYREVLKVRQGDEAKGYAGKPVVAAMMDIAASGGYYVACGADEIVAEPTSVTGSIGVVMLTYNVKGLFDKVGVSTDAIKSGPMKDASSPFRPMKPEERQLFQSMITEYYENFLTVVAASRTKLSKDEIRKLADGRIYTGRQACSLGLVDEIGGLEDAIENAKARACIHKARVIMYDRPAGYRGTIYSESEHVKPEVSQNGLINVQIPEFLQQQGAFLYLWQP